MVLNRFLTLWGWFWTISTASWLLRCSHSPSEANMRNWSWGWSLCTEIEGSELKIGLLKGSWRRNLAYNGSLLNSAFFRYTSPIDLEICNIISHNIIPCQDPHYDWIIISHNIISHNIFHHHTENAKQTII